MYEFSDVLEAQEMHCAGAHGQSENDNFRTKIIVITSSVQGKNSCEPSHGRKNCQHMTNCHRMSSSGKFGEFSQALSLAISSNLPVTGGCCFLQIEGQHMTHVHDHNHEDGNSAVLP